MPDYIFKTYIDGGREYYEYTDAADREQTIKKDFLFPESLMSLLYMDIWELEPITKRMDKALLAFYQSGAKDDLQVVAAGLDELASRHVYFELLRLDLVDSTAPGDFQDLLPHKKISHLCSSIDTMQKQIKGLIAQALDIDMKCFIDYQPPIFRTIHLDEVVSAAKGADASHCAIEVDLICATQLRQIEFRIQRMDLVSHLSTVGNLLPNQRVQTLEINLTLGQFHRFHAAADINADHAWNDFAPNGHGGTNRTALASVDIRHNADLAAREFLLITDRLDLGAGCIFQYRGIAESGII